MRKDRYTDLLIFLIRKDTRHLCSYFSAQTPLGPGQAENRHVPAGTLHAGGGIMKLLGGREPPQPFWRYTPMPLCAHMYALCLHMFECVHMCVCVSVWYVLYLCVCVFGGGGM